MKRVVFIKDENDKSILPVMLEKLEEKIGSFKSEEVVLPYNTSLIKRVEILMDLLYKDPEYILYIGKIPEIDIAFWDYVFSRDNRISILTPRFKVEKISESPTEIKKQLEKIGEDNVLIKTDGNNFCLMRFIGFSRIKPIIYFRKIPF